MNKLQSKKYYFTCLLVATFTLHTLSGIATNYYVSSVGNDANSGTSETLAWRSLAKVNSFTPKPGDQILFRRGDEWNGSISVKASGSAGNQIIYGAFGTGENPRIYGSEKITGWTQYSGNIYKATFNTALTQLFVGSARMKVARYPNTGYINVAAVNSTTQLTCNALNAGINYAGAKLTIRTNNWRMDTRDVVSSSSQTINIDSELSYPLTPYIGFFLCNKLAFLDAPGEWYYDDPTNTVYLWTPNGDSPSNYEVRGSIYNIGILSSAKNYLTVSNLNIAQHSDKGIDLQGNYLTIDNNYISDTETNGIIVNGSNCTITNNKITGINHIGMSYNGNNSTISDNEFLNTALFDNLGLRGLQGYSVGLEMSGESNLLRYNRIINASYNGISWGGINNTIEYNYFDNVCTVLTDGGGIYTYNSVITNPGVAGSIVRSNIILNCPKITYALYMDQRTHDVLIENNTVAHCENVGIFLHYTKNIEVRNNTLFDISRSMRAIGPYGGNSFNNNIVCNIAGTFDSGGGDPKLAMIKPAEKTITLNNNTYIDHHRTNVFMDTGAYAYLNFSQWKTATSQDASSSFDGTALGTGESEELFYNDTKLVKSINLGNIIYRDLSGNQVTGTFTLNPFTSRILVKTKSVTVPDTTPPIISSFTIPATAISLTVDITTFSASDNTAVTGFKLTETSTSPTAGSTGWNTVAPTSYVFTVEGTKTLYAWTKDAAGNVSTSKSAQVLITLPDVTKPIISTFTIPSTSTSLTVPISSLTATDNKSVTGFKLTETSVTPNAGDAGWTSVAPTSYVFSTSGTKTLYAWVKDAAGNISTSVSDQVVITLADVTKPTVTGFAIPSTSTSLTVPVSIFTATDNVAVSGFKLTETSAAPNAGDIGWTAIAPTSYSFSGSGTKTLYAWVKDAAGNVSTSLSDQVIITLSNDTSPFSEYLFEETSGSVVMDSKGSNDGTIINTGSRVAGIRGSGLGFTGSGYINLGQVFGESVQNELTLSAWIKPTGTSGSWQGIITHEGPNINTFTLYINPDLKKIGFKTTGTSPQWNQWIDIANVNTLWDGNWHQVSVTYDGAQKIIYLDGVALKTVNSTGTIESGKGYNLMIGAASSELPASSLYKGLIDEVRIYNYGLTAAEITDSYSLTDSPFSEYLFEETSGSVVVDSKGSNDGTIINTGSRVAGVRGSGLGFTGSGYVNLGQVFGESVQNELTLSAWIKPTGTSGSWQGIITHEGPNINTFTLYINPDLKKIGFKTTGTSPQWNQWIDIANVNTLWDGNWHQVSVTYDGAQKIIYLDGVALKTVNSTGTIESGKGYNLMIGAASSELPASSLYKGLIDEVRIYNYGLTAAEITDSYNLASSGTLKIARIADTMMTGIKVENSTNQLDKNNFSLYPNPAKSFVNANYSYFPEIETRIMIIDNTGRTVLNRFVESTSNTIDISQFPSGIYFVKSINLQWTKTEKLIISK
jgi:hypothetical protein